MISRQLIAILFFVALLFSSPPSTAQPTSLPPVRAMWVTLNNDSVRIEYSTPSITGTWPSVIVLSDRFGIGNGVRGVLRILGRMGISAYALPLRSATAAGGTGAPAVDFDSTDADLIVELTAEISSGAGSNGRIGLLGFDTGATAAIIAAARMPFYKSCVLFYPSRGRIDLERMLQVQCPMQLHVPQYGSGVTLQDVTALKEAFIDAGRIVRVRYYKEASPFFFNPEHSDYHKKNTEIGWNEMLEYLKTNF